MKYTLANVQERAENNCAFEIPSCHKRKRLRVGYFAKLVFENGRRGGCVGERMWVRVTSTDGQGMYRGTLENEPVDFAGILNPGDFIDFSYENIAEIQKG